MNDLIYWKADVSIRTEDSDTGKIKKVNEAYLVKAYNATDVEAQVTKSFANTSFDYYIKRIAETNIIDVLVAD